MIYYLFNFSFRDESNLLLNNNHIYSEKYFFSKQSFKLFFRASSFIQVYLRVYKLMRYLSIRNK